MLFHLQVSSLKYNGDVRECIVGKPCYAMHHGIVKGSDIMDFLTYSNVGRRKNNQDSYWASVINLKDNATGDSADAGIVCVCDGMGGLDNGKLASEIVVSNIMDYMKKGGSIDGIVSILERSNKEIQDKVEGKSGTTCVLCIACNGYYTVFNVGDSRCYKWNSRVNNSQILRITNDHTVLEEFRREGKIINNATRRKYKNVLTRCVGVPDKINCDIFSGSYNMGDVFLVCSDGFWHTLSQDDFKTGNIFNLQKIASRAMDMGEQDNITACILRV